MTARLTVSLGFFLCALCLTAMALFLRRYASERYGDFWKIWGEPPRPWFITAASQLVGVSLIDVGGAMFPEQARIIQGVMGFGALIIGGIGVWWLLHTTRLR